MGVSGIVGGIFKGKSSELSRWAFLLGLLVGTERRSEYLLVRASPRAQVELS